MSSSTERPPLADTAPSAEQVTDYDRTHMTVYVRLLDAVEANAAWQEIAEVVLEIDAAREPERARRRFQTHLARAQWLASHGYRDLLLSNRP